MVDKQWKFNYNPKGLERNVYVWRLILYSWAYDWSINMFILWVIFYSVSEEWLTNQSKRNLLRKCMKNYRPICGFDSLEMCNSNSWYKDAWIECECLKRLLIFCPKKNRHPINFSHVDASSWSHCLNCNVPSEHGSNLLRISDRTLLPLGFH